MSLTILGRLCLLPFLKVPIDSWLRTLILVSLNFCNLCFYVSTHVSIKVVEMLKILSLLYFVSRLYLKHFTFSPKSNFPTHFTNLFVHITWKSIETITINNEITVCKCVCVKLETKIWNSEAFSGTLHTNTYILLINVCAYVVARQVKVWEKLVGKFAGSNTRLTIYICMCAWLEWHERTWVASHSHFR